MHNKAINSHPSVFGTLRSKAAPRPLWLRYVAFTVKFSF